MARKKRRGGYGFSVNLTGPGTMFTLGIIAIAIGMGVLLTRGVTPKPILSDPGETGLIEVVPETPAPDEKGLQLRTIKFRECQATSAISMQLDITGSMARALPDLKRAVLSLVEPLSDDSVIGIQAYNSFNSRVIVVPIDLYGNIKDQVRPRVLSLTADGFTPTYDALIFSGELLAEAQTRFPDREFNYIFFSDGQPNRGPSTDAEIAAAAQTIKDLGVTVYAIGFGNVSPSTIRAIATDSDEAIFVASSAELERVYKEIAQRICESQVTPTETPAP